MGWRVLGFKLRLWKDRVRFRVGAGIRVGVKNRFRES